MPTPNDTQDTRWALRPPPARLVREVLKGWTKEFGKGAPHGLAPTRHGVPTYEPNAGPLNCSVLLRDDSRLRHDRQGEEVEPVVVDAATGHRLGDPADYVFSAGPAAGDAVRARYPPHLQGPHMTTRDDPRCAWALGSDLMTAYHDTEWGRPAHDDTYLFELLLLEGAQAGLSWSTVLNKRENYRRALDGFAPEKIAAYGRPKLDELLADPGIVRNRLKIQSTVKNARAFLTVGEEFGSFDTYLWQWVDGAPVVNHPKPGDPLPVSTGLSDRISKDLKRRGFTFVGTTIVYAYLQAVGVIDDHVNGCPAKP